MNHTTRRFKCTTMVACIAALEGALIGLSGCGGSKPNPAESHPVVQQSQFGHIKWEQGSSGRALQAGTRYVSFDNYVSDDGTQAQRSVEHYRSLNEARSRVAELLKGADKIIERQPKNYYDGRSGERIVLLSNKTESGDVEAFVCWQYDSEVEILQSTSLRHVLDLEQQIYQPPPPATPSHGVDR